MEIINSKNPLLNFTTNSVENIRKIYNLENDRIVQSVDLLEEWIKKQNHFLNKNFNRRYLEITIITCKGSVEKAKKQIDKMCTLRTLLPKYFISSNVRSICDELNGITCVTLPKQTKDYYRVVALKISGNKNITSSIILDFYRYIIVLAEYIKANDYSNGFIIVEDYTEVNLMDLMTKLNFIEFQQFVTILVEGYGARLKGVHMVSQSKVVDLFVKAIKAVVPEKLANRMHAHPDMEDLHKIVDKKILPVDFGGEERSMKELQGELTQLLCTEENEKYLQVMKESCSDESLRDTDKFNEQYMGLPGSFRTLTVD